MASFVEEIPKSQVEIEMKDNGNPIVKLLLEDETSRVVNLEKDGILKLNIGPGSCKSQILSITIISLCCREMT